MYSLTKKSILIANQKDYLDQISNIYPMVPEELRPIEQRIWDDIKKYFDQRNDIELIKSLLKLDLFPVKDSYIAYLRHS